MLVAIVWMARRGYLRGEENVKKAVVCTEKVEYLQITMFSLTNVDI